MRIAYLCADFGIPILGHKGASVHVREMVTAFATLGHEVRIFSPTPGEGNTLGVTIDVIADSGLPARAARLSRILPWRHDRLAKEVRELAYNVTLYRRLCQEFELWRPDMLYERYSLFTVAGVLLARRYQMPHVLEVNAPLRLERQRTHGLALTWMSNRTERFLYQRSDLVMTVSSALQRYAVQQCAHIQNTHVLSNAVDTTRFRPQPERATLRARLGIANDEIVVGFAGSLKPWHGTDLLIEACALLKESVATLRLLIVGEGPQGGALRQQVHQLNLGDRVIFTGKIDHDAMPLYLSAMDIGVAPYRSVPDFYFSPLKIYEYMATGLAVVATEIGDLGSLVRDGETGVLVSPDSSAYLAQVLLTLSHDARQRRALGERARYAMAGQTWAANAQRIGELVSTLSSQQRGAR